MITVQADGNKLFQNKDTREYEEVLDSNENGLAYISDAMLAVGMIVAHSESKYGPIITNLLLEAMENGTLRNAINKTRGEKANEDQTGNCPGC